MKPLPLSASKRPSGCPGLLRVVQALDGGICRIKLAGGVITAAQALAVAHAAQTYAAMTRDQWANYVNTFVPLENQLIQYATDPTQVTKAMTNASADVNASFDQQEGATQRRLRGLGVTLDADQQAAQKRQFGLSRALADAGAQNTAGDLTRQRQQSILGNPAPVTGA